MQLVQVSMVETHVPQGVLHWVHLKLTETQPESHLAVHWFLLRKGKSLLCLHEVQLVELMLHVRQLLSHFWQMYDESP